MKTGFLFPPLHSAAPAQPKRSFNSTFGLQVVFFRFMPFTVQSLSLPWQTLMCAGIPIHTPARAVKPQYSNCVSKQSSSLSLISLLTVAVTCLKHFSITFHYSRGQIPQKRNPFCLWITFFNSKMFKPEKQPWQTGCRKVQILGARYWFAFSINFFKLREVTPSSQLQSLVVVLH